MERDIIIYSDTRENKSRVVSILKKKCNLVEKNLPISDYQASNNVFIERKTTLDFSKSIIDGRLFRQLDSMKKSMKCPLLLIEGKDIMDVDISIHKNAILGALSSVATDIQIPILWTKNQIESAETLFIIAKREQIGKKKEISLFYKKKSTTGKQFQENLISSLPKINTIKARKILKHFKTPEKALNASEKELLEVEGVGKKIASSVKKILKRRYA